MAWFTLFKKKELDMPAEPLKEESSLKPYSFEEPKPDNNDIKLLITKLDIVTIKLDSIDRRLQRIEELAKER